MTKLISDTREARSCRCTASNENDAERTATIRPRASRKAPATFSYLNFLLCLLLILIMSDIQPAECRRLKKNKNKDSEAAMEEGASESGGSRRRTKGILKSVLKARYITQKKYLKKDWCNSRPLKQVVRSGNGCKGVFINHFCYGQCNSFYIPRDLTPDMTEPQYFKSCAFCKPHREETISVTLKCSRNRGKRNKVIKRMVKKIKECRCIAVPDVESRSASPASPASSPAASSSTSIGSAMTAIDSSGSKR